MENTITEQFWCISQTDCTLTISHSPLAQLQERDHFKKMVCKQNGITLVVVPFWWNGRIESLAKTVHLLRPDLDLPLAWLQQGEPIPAILPNNNGTMYFNLLIIVTVHFMKKELLLDSNTDVTGLLLSVA